MEYTMNTMLLITVLAGCAAAVVVLAVAAVGLVWLLRRRDPAAGSKTSGV
jgi:hypothetical protein